MLERYPIDTGQLERGTAAAFWLATITLDFSIPTALTRGSQLRRFNCRQCIWGNVFGPWHPNYVKPALQYLGMIGNTLEELNTVV
jgi:hypothetical protein